jgi:hypothetical protein
MPRFFSVLKAVFTGLAISQILSTLHVYLSNVQLHRITTAIGQAGYLAVPNPQVTASLESFGPAFFGGLFFTFTVGACLSVCAIAAAWLWSGIRSGKTAGLFFLLICWSTGLWAVNSRGFNAMVTAYFLGVPLIVFWVSLKWLSQTTVKFTTSNLAIHLVCFTILLLICSRQFDVNTFLSVRDRFLLSNPAGQTINNFYYKYNLFAAQVFKSIDQKTLKTCDLSAVGPKSLAGRLAEKLLNYDYLNLGPRHAVDLRILNSADGLDLVNKNRMILHTTSKQIFEKPEFILRQFSEKSDTHRFFRRFTFFSMLFLSAVTVYGILYTLFYNLTKMFLNTTGAGMVAGILCCMAGLTLWIPTHFEKSMHFNPTELAKALENNSVRQRTDALKVIVQKKIDVAPFPIRTTMLASPCIAERYWTALAMGYSRDPKIYPELLGLLDDAQINVVCAALYAMGKRGDRMAIGSILKLVKASDCWYIQWYAYRALRNLGWKQTK